jgi:hypothetical protein
MSEIQLRKSNPFKWYAISGLVFAQFIYINQAQAGTATFFAKCSFLDHKANNGGNISRMPCYVYMGGNISHTFFTIRWKDGIITDLRGKNTGSVMDISTSKTYKINLEDGRHSFIADRDGDIILVEDIKSSRPYSDDNVLKILQKKENE